MRLFFLLIFLTTSCATTSKNLKSLETLFSNLETSKGFDFHGFAGHQFKLDDFDIKVVLPKTLDKDLRWIWRARFFGHEPQLDIALLNKGFCVVYTDIGGLYGSPKAVSRWDKTYDFMTRVGLHKKVVLEGMSRGGLITYNWAKQNPKKVAAIYADAPVCHILSWPAGKGNGPGSKNNWQECLNAYSLTESTALSAQVSPIDGLEPLAKAKVPIIHVCGADDKVVPMAENTEILASRYRKLGGKIKVISKPGVGHHPHSLKDPKVILDFILEKGLF
ncbi:MAG: alpha/beta hydrolase [Lentisphaeraceae bacterium]|nr:alpha/beta hydrolase [Lentisphaeraceae bacterium]